jgi:hypothetical protein
LRAVIDRFEGDFAVLLFNASGIKVDMPRVLLPPGAGEGDILAVTFEVDREETCRQRQKIEALLKKLQENNS